MADKMVEALNCSLCVVGAGVAGLNALSAATRYLKKTDTVVLIESRDRAGGMWCDVYDYVRLHQPHRLFTAGNIPWSRQLPPAYLADRREVEEQLHHCLSVIAQRVNLVMLFGHRYQAHVEPEAGSSAPVEVLVTRLSDDTSVKVRSHRLIKATSNHIEVSRPLAFESQSVESTTPHHLSQQGSALGDGDKPVFIVGGGKTAMDTAHYLIQHYPGRDIRMIVGDGVMFVKRDLMFPSGTNRWFGGHTSFGMFLDVALKFDGLNTAQASRHMLEKYCLSLHPNPRQFQVGLISEAEISVIRDGLSEVITDHLVDVVDGDGVPQLRLRSGAEVAIPAGSWFINCTGYLPKTSRGGDEPYISDGGRVLSINPSSLVFFLGSFSAYFLTHLMYRNQLDRVPLYQASGYMANARYKEHLGLCAVTQTVLNVLMVMKALPLSVMNECLIDLNRWYPTPRRLPIQLQYMINNQRYQLHCRQTLDRLHETTGFPIGPLPKFIKQSSLEQAA